MFGSNAIVLLAGGRAYVPRWRNLVVSCGAGRLRIFKMFAKDDFVLRGKRRRRNVLPSLASRGVGNVKQLKQAEGCDDHEFCFPLCMVIELLGFDAHNSGPSHKQMWSCRMPGHDAPRISEAQGRWATCSKVMKSIPIVTPILGNDIHECITKTLQS
jgi:hypothetical protein